MCKLKWKLIHYILECLIVLGDKKNTKKNAVSAEETPDDQIVQNAWAVFNTINIFCYCLQM